MWTFVAILAGLISGALMSVIAAAVVGEQAGHRNRRSLIAGSAVGVIVFAVVQANAQVQSQSQTSGSTPTSVVTPLAGGDGASTEATPSVAVGSTWTTGRSTSTTGESPTSLVTTSLLDLPAVELDTNDTIDLDAVSPFEADGSQYGRALVYECSLFCNGSSPQVREVALGRKYARFTATAAVLDTAGGTHRIEVTLDNNTPRVFSATPGAPASIDLNVSGVSRMRIDLYAPGPLKNPVQAGADSTVGKNGGGLPGVAIADPLLIPR